MEVKLNAQPITQRYLIFAGADYYPSGGACDLTGASQEREQAIAFAEKRHKQIVDDATWDNAWAHVFDTHTGEIIWEEGKAVVDPRDQPSIEVLP